MIPTAWNQITIGQYQMADGILKRKLTDVEQRIELALLFAGPDSERWTVQQLREETSKLTFLEHEPSSKMCYGFSIDGKEYLINPIAQSLTAGQYIDLSSILKNKDTISELHNIMAVLAVEKGKNYEGYVYNATLFQDKLTMEKVFPVSAFFLTVGKSCLKIIERFLTKEVGKAKKEMKKLQKELA